MIPRTVQDYITARYCRWLDYAAYLFPASGADGEPRDLLNEVLLMLLEKDAATLLTLVSTRKGIYTELDFFVLKMIKTNATSPTSPYRYRYRRPTIDAEADFSRLELADASAYGSMYGFANEPVNASTNGFTNKSADKLSGGFAGRFAKESAGASACEPSGKYDRNEEILRRFTLVREVFERLDLSEEERSVFTFRFFHDRPFSEWTGDIPQRRLYRIYDRVIARIRREIEEKVLY